MSGVVHAPYKHNTRHQTLFGPSSETTRHSRRRPTVCATAAATTTKVQPSQTAPIQQANTVRVAVPKVAAPSAAAPQQSVLAPYHATDETILLQGFGWDSCDKGGWYDTVRAKVPDIKGYMPGLLYNVSTSYGDIHALKQLTDALNSNIVAPVADVVINHRCAEAQDENGVWNEYRDDVTHRGLKVDWGKWAVTGDDPVFHGTGNKDTGADYNAAPDLDHSNPELRASLKDWMNWLASDLGFRGWRFDFVKGYGAQYVNEYITDTLGPQFFHVGEYWTDSIYQNGQLAYDQDASRQLLCDYVYGAGGATTLFDFPTKGILQEACRDTQYSRLRAADGRAPGLLGWWPDHAVTFVDNHDTGSTQQLWPFPSDKVEIGYAYVLTHPGIPCVFWDHHFTWGLGSSISEMIAIRGRNGIKAGSKLEILEADGDCYMARVNDNVIVKLGPRYDLGSLQPDNSWKLAHSGNDFAIWDKK